MMLHNFVIDTGVQMFPLSQNGPIHIEDDDIEPLTNGPDTVIGYNLGYLPVLPQRGQQITTETVTTIAPTRTEENNTIIRRPNILREIQNMCFSMGFEVLDHDNLILHVELLPQ